MNYVCLDIETTGDQIQDKEIIELAAVRYSNGKKSDTFHSFVKPKQQVSKFILNLTKIKKKDLHSAPSFKDIYPALKTFLKTDLLIAHNINFDMTILTLEAERIGNTKLSNLCLDSADLSLLALPNLTKQSLKALAYHFNIPLQNQHRALHDTLCLGEVVLKLKELLCDMPSYVLSPIYYSNIHNGLHYFVKQLVKTPPIQSSISKLVKFVNEDKKNACSTDRDIFTHLPSFLSPQNQNVQTVIIPPTKAALLNILAQHPQILALNGSPYMTGTAIKKQLFFWKEQCLLQSALLHWWLRSKDHSILHMHTRLKQSLNSRLLTTIIPKHLQNTSYLLSSLEEYCKALKQNLFKKKILNICTTASYHSILKQQSPLSGPYKSHFFTLPSPALSNWSCNTTTKCLPSPKKTIKLLEKEFEKPCLLGLFYRSNSFANHLANYFYSQKHVRCLFHHQPQIKYIKQKPYPQLVLMPMSLEALEHALKFQKLVWTGSTHSKKYRLFLETLLWFQHIKKLPVIWLDRLEK